MTIAVTSLRGKFGDSVEEMDAAIGEIIASLKKSNLYEDTMIIFTSDNGAWTNPSNGLNDNRRTKGVGPFDGGSNAPFQGGKGSTWEGGFRVPLLVSLPSKLPANELIMSAVTAMDLFPTILDIAGVPLPQDVVLDGVSLVDLMLDPSLPDPHECVYLWREHTLYAIRCGSYKIHYVTRSGFEFSDPGTVHDPPLLFNVDSDPAEAISLDTTVEPYRTILRTINTAAQQHLDTVTMAPSVYLAQNFTVAPCCPRGSYNLNSDAVSIPLLPFHEVNSYGTTEQLQFVEKFVSSYNNDKDLLSEVVNNNYQEGPWRKCICQRISL